MNSKNLFRLSPIEQESLGKTNIKQFIDYLNEIYLDGAEITIAAEIAGRCISSHEIVPVLIKLLEHPSPLAREGVVLGLSFHDKDKEAVAAIKKASEEDPSEVVRECALNSLCFMEFEVTK